MVNVMASLTEDCARSPFSFFLSAHRKINTCPMFIELFFSVSYVIQMCYCYVID